MPNLPITGLPTTNQPKADDRLVTVQDGVTRQIPLSSSRKTIIETTPKTSNYTLLSSDEYIPVNATSGTITISIPSASGNAGKRWIIVKADSSTNSVIIKPDGSETINGAATYSLSAQYDFVEIMSNGSEILITAQSGSTDVPLSKTFNYNGDGTVNNISDASKTVTFTYTGGRLNTISDGSVTRTFNYDVGGSIISITVS